MGSFAGQTRRIAKIDLGRAGNPRIHLLVAAGHRDLGLYAMERKNGMLWNWVRPVARRYGPAPWMRWRQPRTSGNQAFDEYRVATLRRLEEEQREFQEFLARLRTAKDKAEFDQFMADRRTRSEPPVAAASLTVRPGGVKNPARYEWRCRHVDETLAEYKARSTSLIFLTRRVDPSTSPLLSRPFAWPACSRLRPQHQHLHRIPTSTPGDTPPAAPSQECLPR